MNQRLVNARRSLGWTMQRASDYLVISLSHYTKLEHGTRKPGVHLARAINNMFDARIYDISSEGVSVKEGD